MKIMPITSYKSFQTQIRKESEPQTAPIETNDKVSFRAKAVKQTNIGTGKRFLRTIAAAIAGMAGMQVIEKPEPEEPALTLKYTRLPYDNEEAKKILKWDFFSPDLKESIDRCFEKDDSRAKYLFDKKYLSRYGHYQYCFSPIEVEAIIDYKTSNPDLASKLEQVLANKEQRGLLYKREQIDYIAKKIQEEPEIVEKFQSEASPITYGYLKAHEIDPKYTERIHKIKNGKSQETRYDGEDILKLIPLHKKYPAAVNALTAHRDYVFSVSAIEKIAPNYRKNKELIANGNFKALSLHKFENLDNDTYTFIV